MLKLPSKKITGDPVKARDFNDILDALKSLVLNPGRGYLIKRGVAGTSLSIKPAQAVSANDVSVSFPWEVSVIKGEGEDDYLIKVGAGKVYNVIDLVNNIDLTQINGGDAIDFDQEYELTESSLVYLLIEYEDDGEGGFADIAQAQFSIVVGQLDSGGDPEFPMLQEWSEDEGSMDEQTFGRVPIAIVRYDSDAGKWGVEQLARNDWYMDIRVFNGKLADWPATL
ncbi:MAG: hypothetical protein ACSHX0_06915 [Akkermansiaceae bacterium]